MVFVHQDRRRVEHGSIICDNGAVRLRIVRPGASLVLVIDARDLQEQWVPLASTPADADIDFLDADGGEQSIRFHSYDPLEVDGRTCGIVLHGSLGNARVSLTSLLPDASTWSQHTLEIHGLAHTDCRRLTQRWHLASEYLCAETSWPSRIIHGDELAESPAAFQQAGPLFAALAPDLEEGDSSFLGVHSHIQDHPCLEYGVLTSDHRTLKLPETLKLAYALCLDARALPQRGFQQIVRELGSQEALAAAGGCATAPSTDALPPLPAVPDATDWLPFTYEGPALSIAALTQHLLLLAEQGDWHLLEDALCWLDRLCFHQRVFETPGGAPLGTIGSGPAWQPTALWMPVLLLHAFRLTGIFEYAHRALTAISALAPAEQALVMGQLAPTYGDIYLHADFQEALALGPVEILSAVCTPGAIWFELDGSACSAPQRLVVDAADGAYTVTVNGHALGAISSAQLRAGLAIPVIFLAHE